MVHVESHVGKSRERALVVLCFTETSQKFRKDAGGLGAMSVSSEHALVMMQDRLHSSLIEAKSDVAKLRQEVDWCKQMMEDMRSSLLPLKQSTQEGV